MRRPRTLLHATVAMLLVAATLQAQDFQHFTERGQRGPGGEMRSLIEFLELTAEQRETWQAAHRAHAESLRPTFEKMRDLRLELRAELDGDAPDAATVGGFVIDLHQLDAEIESSRGELDATIAEILTDEQETKLEAWQAAHPGRRHRPGGPGGPGFGGPA